MIEPFGAGTALEPTPSLYAAATLRRGLRERYRTGALIAARIEYVEASAR
jgi:hypothetical protein